MSDTPKELLDALNMVTAPKLTVSFAQPELLSMHHNRVRTAFEDPNIVAVGISEKRTGKRGTGELSLTFYVEKKRSLRRTDAAHAIPPVLAGLDGRTVFTDVKEIGRLVPQGRVNQKSSPLQSGFSVANGKDTAGTLGAIVRKGSKLYILSNSHVLARAGRAKKGERILYPGPADGGTASRNTVARLSHSSPFVVGRDFKNKVDAALAEIDTEHSKGIDYTIGETRTPIRTIAPKRGMRVVKVGRTSGRTESVVRDAHFRVLAEYPGVGTVGFLDQVLCDTYTEGGDSGSIVVDKSTGKIVGLHFLGSSKGSVFTPIAFIMDALGFRFASR